MENAIRPFVRLVGLWSKLPFPLGGIVKYPRLCKDPETWLSLSKWKVRSHQVYTEGYVVWLAWVYGWMCTLERDAMLTLCRLKCIGQGSALHIIWVRKCVKKSPTLGLRTFGPWAVSYTSFVRWRWGLTRSDFDVDLVASGLLQVPFDAPNISTLVQRRRTAVSSCQQLSKFVVNCHEINQSVYKWTADWFEQHTTNNDQVFQWNPLDRFGSTCVDTCTNTSESMSTIFRICRGPTPSLPTAYSDFLRQLCTEMLHRTASGSGMAMLFQSRDNSIHNKACSEEFLV